MKFEFTVTVEVEREEGKFASRNELSEELRQLLEDADPGQVEGENGGIYVTSSWDVSGGG